MDVARADTTELLPIGNTPNERRSSRETDADEREELWKESVRRYNARRREVTQLTRKGLGAALEALEGRVDVVGTSGFTTREDVLLATASPDAGELVKGA